MAAAEEHGGWAMVPFCLAFTAAFRLLWQATGPLGDAMFAGKDKEVLGELAERGSKQRLVWRNTVVSLVHSLLSGVLATACTVLFPAILTDVQFAGPFAVFVVSLSNGYMIHETIEIYQHGLFLSWPSLYVHHAVVITCFSLALGLGMLEGLLTLTLICEVSNIFMHSRRLLRDHGVAPTHPIMTLVYYASVFTTVVFRLFVHIFIIQFMFFNRAELPFVPFLIAMSGMAYMMYMNVDLIRALVRSRHRISGDDRKTAEPQNGTKTD